MLLDWKLQQDRSLVNGIALDKWSAVDVAGKKVDAVLSQYSPSDDAKKTLQMIIKHFRLGDMTMRKPRREFNDLSVLTRTMVDQMSFNAYQPNNGDALEGDEINSWRSRAIRPIARNKVISIAAHATARMIFPKVFSWDRGDEAQQDAAQVMEDLMEWSGNDSDWSKTMLYATIASLVNPACIIYTDYAETYRKVKRGRKTDGSYETEVMLDEDFSGFREEIVPIDEFFIENIYEHDIQKQAWLIRRRVLSWETAETIYSSFPNWKFIRNGIQLIFSDANTSFYEVYDSNMRGDMVEEITYWNKSLDLKIIAVNGVMLTEADNPNPRNDKAYPFVKFGYELIDEGKFFYYKSLVFKMQQDEKIINTLYPMVIDLAFLKLFPPMIATGAEAVSSDIIIPGLVTTFQSKDAQVVPLNTANDINAGMNALQQVEKNITETTNDQYMVGPGTRRQPAYVASIIQQNANILLGLFVNMISCFVKDFGRLRIGDILQFMTIGEAGKIEGKLVYKTFLLSNKGEGKVKKIKFDSSLPEKELSDKEKLKLSYETLALGGGIKSKTSLARVNPRLFRELKFITQTNPDVLNPMSDELEKQYGLEAYDRLIKNSSIDQEQVTKDFLLKNYPTSKKDPDKYFPKAPQGQQGQNPLNNPAINMAANQNPRPQGKPMPQLPAMQIPSAQGVRQKVGAI